MDTFGKQERIDLSEISVAVFGLGKMGLPLACVLADRGANVLGVDIDSSVVEAVNAGRSPIENEPRVPALLSEHGGHRLEATTEGGEAASRADVILVLVPTVVDEAHEPILDPVRAAADDIRSGVDEGDLVVLESTVPPGTTAEEFASAVEPEHLVAGEDFSVAHCPERTSSGRVIKDVTESYPKIVGGLTAEGTRAAAAFYRSFNEPGVITVSSAMAAEAVKVFEGVYRDVNIALANELAVACEQWGLDSAEIFEAANSQPYCDIHVPGCGVGGHCIPVYPHFVVNRAERTPLLETARQVNDGMPGHTVRILESLLEGEGTSLSESRILVMGVTYRGGVREIRNAPAIDIIDILNDRGADVYANDPLLSPDDVAELGATFAKIGVRSVDAVVLATGHAEYDEVDLTDLRKKTTTGVFVDGRRFYEPEEMEEFVYATIGRGDDQV